MRLMLMLMTAAALTGLAAPPLAPPPVPAVGEVWPVGTRPAIVRGWAPPATEYGAGHRGVDLAAPVGAPVRAVAPGRVSFAGRVAGRGVVAIELSGTGDPPLRTTYEPVTASMKAGDTVTPGAVVGTLEPATGHCGPTPCLHWGLLRASTYLDPLSLLPPRLLHGGPSRLLPVPLLGGLWERGLSLTGAPGPGLSLTGASAPGPLLTGAPGPVPAGPSVPVLSGTPTPGSPLAGASAPRFLPTGGTSPGRSPSDPAVPMPLLSGALRPGPPAGPWLSPGRLAGPCSPLPR